MEDILASIRRILSEDEPPAAPQPEETTAVTSEPGEDEPDEVLVLDNSMLVTDPEPVAPSKSEPEPEAAPAVLSRMTELLAPEAAAAATSSVSNLVRTLSADRATPVYHGGPTIEDIVREEVRPILKQWLDVNLPPLVERLVRAEIERVVARVLP
jgi:hypothetical protein